MRFHDPDRPRSYVGMPYWLASTTILPGLVLVPESGDVVGPRWLVKVFHGGNGRTFMTSLFEHEVPTFLAAWNSDPEKTFRDFFAEEPPQDAVTWAHPDPESLRGRTVVFSSKEPTIVINDDLDF